jgi:hypothetical protein
MKAEQQNKAINTNITQTSSNDPKYEHLQELEQGTVEFECLKTER